MTINTISQSIIQGTTAWHIQKDDTYIAMPWKLVAGRVASSVAFLWGSLEFLAWTAAAAVTSPLYLVNQNWFDNTSVMAFSKAREAGSATTTATARFFGLANVEVQDKKATTTPTPQQPRQANEPTIQPLSKWQHLRAFANDIMTLPLRYSNTTFVLTLTAIAGIAAYHFDALSWIQQTINPEFPLDKPEISTGECPNFRFSFPQLWDPSWPHENSWLKPAWSTFKNSLGFQYKENTEQPLKLLADQPWSEIEANSSRNIISPEAERVLNSITKYILEIPTLHSVGRFCQFLHQESPSLLCQTTAQRTSNLSMTAIAECINPDTPNLLNLHQYKWLMENGRQIIQINSQLINQK